MVWILMIYFGSTTSYQAGQGGFSTEFNDLQSCKAAYKQYVQSRPDGILGTVSGVCVPKKGGA